MKSLKSLGKMILLIFCFILLGTTDSRKFNEINLVRNYIGCFRNLIDSHRCSFGPYDIRSCLACCLDYGSTFAGLKNGSSCYCGENFERSSDESNCQMKCPHSELRNCGGKLDYSVFSVCEIGYHGNECNQPCNGCSTSVLCLKNNGRCLYGCHDNWNDCDISRLLTDVNIAFKRPVNQSSTHVNGERISYPPELAVDGSFSNTFDDKYKAYCSQTKNDDIPWFRVDLGQSTSIRSIVITNRAGGYGSRLTGVTIYLLNELPTDIIDNKNIFNTLGKYCNKRENIGDQDITVEMNCMKEINGRYLFAVLPGKQHLTICEIEVFAKNCFGNKICKTNEQCQQINFDGSVYHRCICRKGFSRQNLVTECQDFNECSEEVNQCGNNTYCVNTIGRYSCRCRGGFEGNPFVGCADVDECSRHDSPCGDNANCTNSIGGFKCTCHHGFKEDTDKGCVGNDERNFTDCRGTNTFCAKNSKCKNTHGIHVCQCDIGFIGNPYLLCIETRNIIISMACLGALMVLVCILFLIYEKCNYQNRQLLNSLKTRKIEAPEQSNTKTIDYDAHMNLAIDTLSRNNFTFIKQFEKIPQLANHTMSIGKEAAKGSNRYINIIPYDYNRVSLTEKGTDGQDYINASHIEIKGERRYIACQGPTNETVSEFWQMIVEQDVSDIVMLTQTMEDNKIKCFQYWPDEYETKFGKYTVTLESSVAFEDYIRRELMIYPSNAEINSKLVTQWHYDAWPDDAVPINLESFLKFHEVVAKHVVQKTILVVHCCSGVGRTGCFIAIDVLLKEAKREGTVDVVDCVSKLMEQRPHMIQSALQYNFIHCALNYSMLQSKTGILMKVFHSHFLSLNQGTSLEDEFQRITEETEFLNMRGNSKSKSVQQLIYPFMGISNHHHIGCYPNSESVANFWNFCSLSKCHIVLVDNYKKLSQKFLPTAKNPLIIENYRVVLIGRGTGGFGTLLDVCVQTKLRDEHAYENKTVKSKEAFLKVLHISSYGELYTSIEFVNEAKQTISSLKNKNRFQNLFVLSPDKSPLACYFVACCDLTEQLSCRKYVDVYKTVLELKRTPVGDTITLDHYRNLYNFIDKSITKRVM